MKRYNVTIEESSSTTFSIEAETMEEAMEIAEEGYKMGRLVVEHDGKPDHKQMMAEEADGPECTEWIEF